MCIIETTTYTVGTIASAVTVTYQHKEISTLYLVCFHQSGVGLYGTVCRKHRFSTRKKLCK